MNEEIKEIKIGMYSTDEILEFMTNGEGRGFMGRSIYDAIIDYITNLQQENKGLKEELNRTFNRKVNAIKYIGREMIHYALYPASKVDGMKIIELLNGVDEE